LVGTCSGVNEDVCPQRIIPAPEPIVSALHSQPGGFLCTLQQRLGIYYFTLDKNQIASVLVLQTCSSNCLGRILNSALLTKQFCM